jgi:hypothetical protein
MIIAAIVFGGQVVEIPQKDAPAPTVFSIAKALAEITVVLGAGLYVVGWNYLNGYYWTFGLSPIQLNAPIQTVLMYALPGIQNTLFLGSIVGVLAVSCVVVWLWRPARKIFSRSPTLLLLVLLLGWGLAYRAGLAGRLRAHHDLLATTTTLPFVKLVSSGTASLDCDPQDATYRMLLRTDQFIYVFRAIDDTDIGMADLRL